MLCLGLVEACRELMSQRDIDLVYNYSLTPHMMGSHTERNKTILNRHTIRLYGSTNNILRRQSLLIDTFPKKTKISFYTCYLHRMLPVCE